MVLVVVVHGVILTGGPFEEKDFLWLSAGKLCAEWLPYMDHLSELFERPVMRAVNEIRPGAWLLHTLLGALFSENPVGYFWVLLVLLAIDGLLVGIVTLLLYNNRAIAATTALLFVVHPQVCGLAARISSASVLLALFWLLVCLIFLLRYKKKGRIILLAPMICSAFLTFSTHKIGLAAIPAVFFLDLVTLPQKWTWRNLVGVFFRMGLVAVPILGFMLIWIPLGNTPELMRLYFVLKLVKPVFSAVTIGVERLLLPLPMNANLETIFPGFDVGQIFLFGLPVLLGLALAAVYQDRKRLFGLMLIFFGLFFQLPDLITVSERSAAYSISFLIPVLGLSVLLGSLLFSVRPKGAAAVLAFGLVLLFGLSAHLNAKIWSFQGFQVQRMAEQLARAYEPLGETDEIYIVGAGKHSSRLLAAHLEFVRRHGISKKSRFSFIQNGAVFSTSKDGPVGQSPRGVTRLPLDASQTFLGYGERGLVDLTPLIKSKILEADIAIKDEKCLPAKWKLGSASVVAGWAFDTDAANPNVVDQPEDYLWFFEGQILPLHPQAGRFIN